MEALPFPLALWGAVGDTGGLVTPSPLLWRQGLGEFNFFTNSTSQFTKYSASGLPPKAAPVPHLGKICMKISVKKKAING